MSLLKPHAGFLLSAVYDRSTLQVATIQTVLHGDAPIFLVEGCKKALAQRGFATEVPF
jgi:hypothetical protein